MNPNQLTTSIDVLAQPWQWAKPAIERRTSKEAIKETLVRRDPTAGYTPSQFFNSELLVQQLPLFSVRTGKIMLDSDPLVQFALNVRDAALSVAEVEIQAKNPQVKAWLEKQWNTLWNLHGNKIRRTKRWGYAGIQPLYRIENNGLLSISGLKDFAPEDIRAQESEGKPCGFRVKHVPLRGPHALWLTYNSEYGSPYGKGCCRRMYPPWYVKWMDHGVEKLIQLRMIKDAYIGDIFWYPDGMLAELPNGNTISFRDLFRQLGENRLSGGALTLPKMYDTNGKELTGYTPPQAIGGETAIFQWRDGVDEQILRGADVPLEVVKASETGSGFSGRSIPFMVLLSVCNSEFVDYVKSIQNLLRIVAWLNFGGDPEFELKPKSLVESFAADAGGSPMGGGAIGGQPGQGTPAPGQSPQQQEPMQRIPQQQSQRFDEEEHSFSSTQFNLPGELAFDVRRLGDRIAQEDLAGDGREQNPHITIKYGLHTNDADEVYNAVMALAPVAVTFGKASVFAANEASAQRGGEQYDVVKIEIESEALHALNASISKALACTDTHPTYQPHCTIAYVKPGLGERYAATLNDLQGKVAVFDRLTFSDKRRNHTSIPLTGTARFEESTPLSTADEISALGATSARDRIRQAAAAITDLAQKKTADLTSGFTQFDLLAKLRTIIVNLRHGITADLQASIFTAHAMGAAEVAVGLPVSMSPPIVPASGGGIAPPVPPSLASLFPDEPPGAIFPALDDALQVLGNARVYTSDDYRAVAEQARAGAFAITADLAEQQVENIRDLLTENIASGADLKAFTGAVQERLEAGGPLSERHIELVFRQNTMAAFSDGANRAVNQPMVVDAFPFRAYFATIDARVRPEHLALEKLGLNGTNIYASNDPVFEKFRPPWDFGCRCSWSVVTVEQAARRGVVEAQEWLARAQAMAEQLGGRAAEYFSRTAPMSREWVTPPGFDVPTTFKR